MTEHPPEVQQPTQFIEKDESEPSTTDIAHILDEADVKLWQLKPSDTGVKLLLGAEPDLARDVLNDEGYQTTELDVPVREKWDSAWKVEEI